MRTWSDIANKEAIPIDTPISCIPTDLGFHGLAKVNITDDGGFVCFSLYYMYYVQYVRIYYVHQS